MGGDINSILSNAMDFAQQRRAAASGVTDSVFNTNGVTQSSEASLGVTELSVEDLAGAMKSREASKDSDNKLISDKTQGIISFDREPKRSKAVESVQDKITAIDNSSVQALARQAAVAQSLKQQNSDPFIK